MRRALVVVLLLPVLAGCGSDKDDYCAAVEDHQEELTELVGSSEPDALIDALDVFRKLQDDAPADISDEWKQLVGAVEGLQEALDDAGVDPSSYDRADPPAGLSAQQKQAIEEAATRLGSAETAQALRDLDQQARDVCHTPLTL